MQLFAYNLTHAAIVLVVRCSQVCSKSLTAASSPKLIGVFESQSLTDADKKKQNSASPSSTSYSAPVGIMPKDGCFSE